MQSFTYARHGLSILGLALALAACVEEHDANDEVPDAVPSDEEGQRTLIAEVSLSDLSVQYHVDAEGNLSQTEVGTPEALAASHPELDPVRRYEILSGASAPSALTSAVEHNGAGGSQHDPTEKGLFVNPIYGDGTGVPVAIGRADFRARNCQADDRDFQFYDQSAPKVYSKTDVNYWKTGVYAASGSLFAQSQMHNVYEKIWLHAGQAMLVTWWVGGKGYRGTTSVSHNTGTYDMCINYHF